MWINSINLWLEQTISSTLISSTNFCLKFFWQSKHGHFNKYKIANMFHLMKHAIKIFFFSVAEIVQVFLNVKMKEEHFANIFIKENENDLT